METIENASPTVPALEKQEAQPTSEAQPAPSAQAGPKAHSSSEVQPVQAPVEAAQSTTVTTPEGIVAEPEKEPGEDTDESEENFEAGVDLPKRKTTIIDGPTFVSQMFSENPGEISKFLSMASKELKKEQDKMKKKGYTMDNKYANLFLLQTIRDECGILVFGCLAAWLLTRLHFSFYWTLFVIGASIIAYLNFNSRQKHLYYNKERKDYNQKMKLNPENPETLNWLNYILQKAWPTAEPLIGSIVKDSVNGILDGISDSIVFDSIKITEFTLGTEAPKLMEMCPSTDTDSNVIKFTCIAKYEPLDTNKISKMDIESGEKRASNICLTIKPTRIVSIPTQVNDILFVGKLLFIITTMESFPYIKKVEVTFTEQPNIKWELKPLSVGVDVMNMPGLNAGVDEIVKKVIASIALEPNNTRIALDVEDILKSMTLDQPIGLLKVNFYEGKELKNTSKVGTDDPYARFSINGNILSKTETINNDLNPAWNHVEYAIVSGIIYSDPTNNSDLALIEVMSSNKSKKDSVIGRAENLYLRHYIALCESLRKKRAEKLREAAFLDRLNKEGITDPLEIKKIRREENQKRKNELLQKEKNKSFAQKLIDSLEKSAEDHIEGLTDLERKEYINQWGNPLVDSDTIVPLYQINKDNKIDKTKPAGNIRMGINYIPLNQFNDNIEDEDSSNLFSETGIARIWIYKITKLEKNPNPYCIVDIDGKEVSRTPIRKYNNNPNYGTFKDVFIKNFSTAKLTITVKDQQIGSDPTIAVFSWDIYEIVERIKEDPAANWFKLSSKFEEAAINIGVEWKPMVMDLSTNLQRPVGVCRLHVIGAKDLKNSETFGKSDPYAKIFLSGKEIGVTDVVENDLNPEWKEVYYLLVRSKNDRLAFEVFNHDEMKKNDRKLGKVEMNITDICRNIKFNGEQTLLSKAWEHMDPPPEVKVTEHGNIGVSVPLFLNQLKKKESSKGRIEFNIKFFEFADLGISDLLSPVSEAFPPSPISLTSPIDVKTKEEEKIEAVLASENTDRTFIEKVQASNLLSGIIHTKIYSVSNLPKPSLFSVNVYFQDEPENILLSTKKQTKLVTEGNIDEIAEGFVRNYKNTRLVFAINEGAGNNIKPVTSFTVLVEQLLVGKVGLKYPFIHICDNNTSKITLGIEYEPLNMELERGELSPQMGYLKVNIDQANVIAADNSGTSDPYVKVLLRGKEIHKTDVFKKTLNPIWNESFSVPIAERTTNKLVFQVYDWNKVQKHDLIGQAEVPLYEIYDTEPISTKIKLYQINKDNEKVICGDISLKFEFQPAIHNTKMNKRIGNHTASKIADGVGSMVGSVAGGVGSVAGGVGNVIGGVTRGIKKVGHSNKKDKGGSCLKVRVISAEGLKAVDNSGTSDPYVKVQHQKKTLFKTKVIKKNLNPTWNEECSIPYDKDSSDPILAFIIKDSNKIGKSVDIGMVEFNVNDILFSTGQFSIIKTFDVQNGPGKLSLQIDYIEDVTPSSVPVEETP